MLSIAVDGRHVRSKREVTCQQPDTHILILNRSFPSLATFTFSSWYLCRLVTP